MRALGRECKGIAPPRAILSSLGAKAPWDDNIALGGAISFALPPEGTQLPIAFTLFNELNGVQFVLPPLLYDMEFISQEKLSKIFP